MPPKTATAPKQDAPSSSPSMPHAKPMPEERQLPASVFQRYPENRIPAADAINEMSESIRTNGQLQPITARSIGRVSEDAPEQFEIIFGETRWLGCMKIHTDFPVRCYVLDIDDKEAAKIHAIENFQRRDLDIIEEARSMKNMLSNGWTMEDVMNHLGRAQDHIYRRLLVLKLDEAGQQALRDKQISLNVATVIAKLEPEQQAKALATCVSPTYQKEPLSEREALRELNQKYVEPANRAKKWEDRRKQLEEDYPGATILSFAEAVDFARSNLRQIEKAEDVPDYQYLTEAAAAKSEAHQQMEIPTWGELARKHGQPLIIACKLYDPEEPAAWVKTLPIIEAERAADPESFFCDPAAEAGDGESDEESEKSARRAEIEREKAIQTAIEGERLKMVEHIMSGGSMTKGGLRKFAEAALVALVECSGDQDTMTRLFPVGDVGDYEETEKAIRAEIAKLFKPKDANPIEVFARVAMAIQVSEAGIWERCRFENSLAALAFETGAFKRADYPALSERFPVPAKVEDQPAPEGSAEAGA